MYECRRYLGETLQIGVMNDFKSHFYSIVVSFSEDYVYTGKGIDHRQVA